MLVTSNGQVASSSCPLLYSVNFVSQKETEGMFFKDTVKVSLKFDSMNLILFCFVLGTVFANGEMYALPLSDIVYLV